MNPHHASVTLFSGKAGDLPSTPRTNSFATGHSLSSKPDPSTQAAFRALLLLAILFATAWLLPSGAMAQATSPTPTLTPTPTPTATSTPALHPPFWNSALGIFIVIVIAILAGLVIGLIARKGGTSPSGTRSTPTNGLVGLVGKLLNMFNDFTNVLAYVVVTFAFLGIFAIARQVIKVGGGQPFDANKALESAKFVFGAILPLLGTWVGAVLAHYFQKESLAAANQSITDLAKTVGNAGKLASLPVKDFMIGPGKIITLPPDLQGKQDSEIPLKKVSDHLKNTNRDRLPLFADNKGSGVVTYVVHLSKIEKYLADKALNAPAADAASAEAPNIAGLTLADLLKDVQPALTFKNFSFVKESATLADAKAAMDSMTSTPGVPGNCYDIFVTATGSPSETVLGWITNDIINQNANV
jgi:hypothetical protein